MAVRNYFRIFAVLCLITLIYIIAQVYYLSTLPKLHPVQQARQRSSNYAVIKRFVDIFTEQYIDLVVVDPILLQDLINENFETAYKPCRYFCADRVYTFAAVPSQYERVKEFLLPSLVKSGFEMDVKYDDNTLNLATHIYLRQEQSAIHVVVFHERHGYWWYKPDHNYESNLHFTQHMGALEPFEYLKGGIDGLDMPIPLYPKQFVSDYASSRFIECNSTRADIFYAMYPPSKSHNTTIFKEAALKTLELAKQLLDELNVPFWISSGTLLGWYRQCDFIPYSKDVDIGIFIKDHRADLVFQFKQNGMHLEHKFGRAEDSLQYAFDMGDVKLDFFFFYEELDHMWNGGTQASSGRKFKYTFPKFTLCWTEFVGLKVRVPCQAQQYIEANYGANWFYPVKDWDWKSSPNNVEEVSSWNDDELDEVIQMWDKKDHRIMLEWERDNKSEL